MMQLHLPWIELCVLLPLAGAFWVARVQDATKARLRCLAVCSAIVACAAGAWIDFAALGASVAHDPWPLVYNLLGDDILVMDRLSAPLLLMAALLYLLTVVATLRTKIRRFSFAWCLISLAILLATFSCRQPWVLVALLAAGTVPPYIELRARGKPTGVYVVHMALFVVLMTVGWGFAAFEGDVRLHSWWAIAPLLAAIFIRGGIIPFHLWTTDLFEHASFGTALLMVTPIVRAYLAIRLVFPVAPVWVLQSIGLLSLATAFYAAGMSLIQREARRFYCYLFISHSALVFAGLESATTIGLTGALCVWLSVSLSLTGFGLTLRALEARRGRLSLTEFHGVYEHTPALAVCFLLTGLASVGFPGTFGFVGTELLVDGAVQAYPYVGVAVAIVAALNGIAVMRAYFLLFTGSRHFSSVSLQIGPRERVAVLTLAALILGGGIIPQPGVLSRYQAAVEILQERESRIAGGRGRDHLGRGGDNQDGAGSASDESGPGLGDVSARSSLDWK
jgi:NADH-quinone oxidoreductase subunit M